MPHAFPSFPFLEAPQNFPRHNKSHPSILPQNIPVFLKIPQKLELRDKKCGSKVSSSSSPYSRSVTQEWANSLVLCSVIYVAASLTKPWTSCLSPALKSAFPAHGRFPEVFWKLGITWSAVPWFRCATSNV
jgi:hypothetical protein